MFFSLVESEMKTVRIKNNQQHRVTMLYLDMRGDALTTAP